jgi:hypothetical protein
LVYQYDIHKERSGIDYIIELISFELANEVQTVGILLVTLNQLGVFIIIMECHLEHRKLHTGLSQTKKERQINLSREEKLKHSLDAFRSSRRTTLCFTSG